MVVSATVAAVAVVVLGSRLLIHWGANWGASDEERAQSMPGDELLAGGPARSVAMTRAVSIGASPEVVWPWLAQMGRGAGYYSYDSLDNGRKASARHIVTWIPAPRCADASAIGYLQRIEEGRTLVWWMSGRWWLGGQARMVVCQRVTPEGTGSRLVIRMSADADGPIAWFPIWAFQILDTLMATRQLWQLKDLVERYGTRSHDPENPESGARDQYQYFEVIYASGERAGVPGAEDAALSRQSAMDDGVIPGP